MSEARRPRIVNIRRRMGVAGQLAYTVTVQYPDEPAQRLQFVGNVYGGPIVMVTPNGEQTFVTDPHRFGMFGPEWVKRFFGYDEGEVTQ